VPVPVCACDASTEAPHSAACARYVACLAALRVSTADMHAPLHTFIFANIRQHGHVTSSVRDGQLSLSEALWLHETFWERVPAGRHTVFGRDTLWFRVLFMISYRRRGCKHEPTTRSHTNIPLTYLLTQLLTYLNAAACLVHPKKWPLHFSIKSLQNSLWAVSVKC